MRHAKNTLPEWHLWQAAGLLACVVLASAAHADPAPETGALENGAPATVQTQAPLPAEQQWAVHGQTTFVEQYHPAFASAYRGPNSLDPASRGDETWDVTLYAGLRPWSGAELWLNPEIDQGFGLSDTLGVAGFPSAEAYKVGDATPYLRLQRAFLRQTIDLGGAAQAVEPDLNQLGGSQTARRLVVTVGKFGVADIFDSNEYAHDARNDFLNWTVIDDGAFDYAADAWGYTVGAAAEWYQDWWTLRAGLFDGSIVPNSPFLDARIGQQFQLVGEAEGRYDLGGQPGKLKLLFYETRARLGDFPQLAAFYALHPGASEFATNAARQLRNKIGGGLNLQQQILPGLGAFLRASLDDGRTEAYEFTDVDQSLASGLSLSGTRWTRPDDTLGAAFVVNQISHAHKLYFEQGDLGLLVGDGKLTNAGPEQIFETYYSYALRKGIHLSVDYQLINHPAYDVSRGPVHVFGVRVHAEF